MNYRILSLDGGGAWALIAVRALIALYDEETTGHAVLGDFDLVAANSGGSLVLGGLVEDLTLGELLLYFEDERKRRSLFSPTSAIADRTLRDLTGIGARYSAEAKLPALQRLLPARGNLPLAKAAAGIRRKGSPEDVHLLIIGFDYDRNRAAFFRSAPAGGPQWGTGGAAGLDLAEAIHASTNAPVNYFDGPAQFPLRTARYWDGAITGCNNPVLAAVTEALVLGQTPSDIVALSIGNGTVVLPLAAPGAPASPFLQAASVPSLMNDLGKLARAIMDDPPDVASFLAYVMTGCGGGLANGAASRIVRMNPLVSPVRDAAGNWAAPPGLTPAQFKYLVDLDTDAVEQGQVDAIAHFAELWLQGKVPNQPIRMDTETLKCELGAPSFQDAVAAWKAIRGGPP